MKATIEAATHEARADGSAAVEAHHLLLAIASEPGETPSRRALAAAGLDRRAVADALDREFTHALAVAGVSRDAYRLPEPTRSPDRAPGLGTSARLAIERGVGSASAPRPAHLLLGILLAEVGTVPRALDLAGVDRADLTDRVRRAASS